jgi:hypothetical protein
LNIALPAIAVILAIIPGVVLRNSYFGSRFPKQAFEPSAISELAYYLILSIPPNLIALACCRRWHFTGIDNESLARVYLGEWSDASILAFVATIHAKGAEFLVAYLLLVTICWICGKGVQRFVWACRLDTRLEFLRMKHDWYYKLYGRIRGIPRAVLPWVDVVVTHPEEGSRIYTGVVSSFEVSRDGDIKELVLGGAHRGKGRGRNFKWVDLKSDKFVILGNTIHSINLRYLGIDPPAEKWKRIRRQIRGFFRSLLLAEP